MIGTCVFAVITNENFGTESVNIHFKIKPVNPRDFIFFPIDALTWIIFLVSFKSATNSSEYWFTCNVKIIVNNTITIIFVHYRKFIDSDTVSHVFFHINFFYRGACVIQLNYLHRTQVLCFDFL